MKRAILAALTCCAIAGVVIGADTTPPKKAVTPARKSSPAATAPHATLHSAASKSAQHSSRVPNTKTGTRTVSTRKNNIRQPVRRSYSTQQLAPTSDRYKEIQDALAAKGYLKTPSTGVWDKDSMDAMQRFQQDQKLDPTGKLTARSLCALGLGPKPAESASAIMPANAANPSTEAKPLQ